MAETLTFPRLIYKGEPDTLGEGKGETKPCESQAAFDADRKDGWRLTRELDEPATDEKKKAAK